MSHKGMINKFTYKEDQQAMEELLTEHGGIIANFELFDFRSPDIKRKEFQTLRNNVFNELVGEYGESCRLQSHPGCTIKAEQVDHLIPLSSNVLNKNIRHIKGKNGTKVPSQSFGSNHKNNFVLACRRCNAYKKHNFPSKELIKQIFALRAR
jgi:5-methylcytosine-specific restriction endonuclease McrA